MLEFIKGVKNEAPFYYFEQISKIPRASGNEAEVARYIYDFARSLSLDAYIDESYNVFVVKNATAGRENDDPIMLQAHTDMVAEKNVGTVHDFANDPIKLIQNGNILSASGTTLGADDGFGVAVMMAVLASDNISHPLLECLFTSSEEIGLVGASKFDYSRVKSRRMINLDSAEDTTVIIGCCGGIRTEFTIPVSASSVDADGIKITVGGLCGGHSGEDINRGRLNSNIIMGKAIKHIMESCPVSLAYISGGDKDNAIPRECEAIIVPSKENLDSCYALACELDGIFKNEGIVKADEDKGLFIKAEIVHTDNVFTEKDTNAILKVLSVPNAVLKYRTEPPILPERSRNLARVRTNEDSVVITFSSRAYVESGLTSSTDELDAIANEINASTYHHEKYPGWISDKESKLVVDWQNAYESVSGQRPEATLIHAGLECGLISAEIPGLVAISVGCNVHDLHTPQETMEIDSMDRIYEAVIEVLK